MTSLATYRRDLAGGARAMAPFLLGTTPFGLLIGVSAAQSDLPTLTGWLTGPAMFSGTAQIAAIQMLDAGAAWYAVVLTVMVISLRLILYSAAMATYWRGTPLRWRLLGGYLLVDPSFAVGVDGYDRHTDRRRGHTYYLGGALVLWGTWLAALAVGATAGAQLPDWLQLEFLIPLSLIGEIVPKLREAIIRWAVLAASVVSLACLTMPMHLGISVGIVAGIAAGATASTRAMSTKAGRA